MPEQTVERETAGAVEEIALDGFDHVEFYVGNALQACYYYHRGFGFDLIGYSGLETGNRDKVSYVLKQDHVTIVLSGALSPNSEIAEHVRKHGDGVKTIALCARDARKAYETAIKRGAVSFEEPTEHKTANGSIVTASVLTYGETVHRFVERQGSTEEFLPGFKPLDQKSNGVVGLVHIDHIVGNVETNELKKWVEYYQKIFGFYIYQYFDAKDISTQYSALVSKVMSNKSGNIKLPINEPAEGLRKSQIQEYLDYYSADGVQHIAITTRDIIATVTEMKKRGIDFLTVPRAYYDTLTERVGKIDENIEELAKLGILVDRDDDGYLLQIFTKPVQDRPTLFFEVIQRKGCKGFGKGNFKALFESIERDQAARGNL